VLPRKRLIMTTPTAGARKGATHSRSGSALRDSRRRETARRIEGIALHLFADDGFDAVTVERIADAAHISARTFFRYFPSKEDVLFENNRRAAELICEAFTDRPPHESADVALRNAIVDVSANTGPEPEEALLRVKVMSDTQTVSYRGLGYDVEASAALVPLYAARDGIDPDGDLRPSVRVASALAATAVAHRAWLSSGGSLDLGDLVARALDIAGFPAHATRS
jgi:AcrR family transcriptional regulator